MIQHEAPDDGSDSVPLVIMTHTAATGNFTDAVEAMDRLPCVTAPSVYYPVAD